MGNKQTTGKKKIIANSAADIPIVEVTEDNHFHAGVDGTGNPFEKYIYPFENVVFEGGGNRLLAYCGAVRVLEEAGIWRQTRRLAGSNSGSIMAALLGVGYSSHDIERFLNRKLTFIFEDQGSCGCCCLFSRLSKKYGCSSGKKLNDWMGKKLEDATGTANITFQQVFERFGKEVCIAVTNVNQMTTEYCHVKTTPTMPIRKAVSMSLATPGIFQPIKYQKHTQSEYYVDGALTCNYPIHCFDGWWLSMDKEDSYLHKLEPLSELSKLMDKRSRFDNYNEKTVGFVLFSEKEYDPLQIILEDREGKILPAEEPKTKLARQRIPKIVSKKEAAQSHDNLTRSCKKFLKMLIDAGIPHLEAIGKSDLESAVKMKTECTEEDFQQIFGKKATADDVFRLLDKTNNQWVTYNELVSYLEKMSADSYSKFVEHSGQEIGDFSSYTHCLQDTFYYNIKKHLVEKRDLERTIGINTYYIGSKDFKMQNGDKKMLLEQGRRSALSYLLYFVTHRHAPLKTEGPRLSYCPDGSLPYYIDDEVPSEIINEHDYSEQFLVVPQG